MYNLSNSHCNPVEIAQRMCDMAVLRCTASCICFCVVCGNEDGYRQTKTKTKEILKPNKCSQTNWNERTNQQKRDRQTIESTVGMFVSHQTHLSNSNCSKLNYEHRTLNQSNGKHYIEAAAAAAAAPSVVAAICVRVCSGATACQ